MIGLFNKFFKNPTMEEFTDAMRRAVVVNVDASGEVKQALSAMIMDTSIPLTFRQELWNINANYLRGGDMKLPQEGQANEKKWGRFVSDFRAKRDLIVDLIGCSRLSVENRGEVIANLVSGSKHSDTDLVLVGGFALASSTPISEEAAAKILEKTHQAIKNKEPIAAVAINNLDIALQHDSGNPSAHAVKKLIAEKLLLIGEEDLPIGLKVKAFIAGMKHEDVVPPQHVFDKLAEYAKTSAMIEVRDDIEAKQPWRELRIVKDIGDMLEARTYDVHPQTFTKLGDLLLGVVKDREMGKVEYANDFDRVPAAVILFSCYKMEGAMAEQQPLIVAELRDMVDFDCTGQEAKRKGMTAEQVKEAHLENNGNISAVSNGFLSVVQRRPFLLEKMQGPIAEVGKGIWQFDVLKHHLNECYGPDEERPAPSTNISGIEKFKQVFVDLMQGLKNMIGVRGAQTLA